MQCGACDPWKAAWFSRSVSDRKAVLITGASSGIGEVTARVLVAHGFRVFLGVRVLADGERVATSIGERCTPVRLDVTDGASIAAAADTIGKAGGIYGLVNNAGIAVGAPLEYIPLDALHRQFDVNVFGVVAVTQAMLPMLRRSLGRIVNVGSIAGRTALPVMGPYSASKAALDLLTQSLRMELAPAEIAVSYVEPGSHRSAIWARGQRDADAMEAQLPPVALDHYGTLMRGMRAIARDQAARAGDPQNVARAIAQALESPRPRARYTVGKDTRARRFIGLLPARTREFAIARFVAKAAKS
jgi:NAD(P)-dependent dehydrogenase (short-subunit alcohol dehydrogenase family)